MKLTEEIQDQFITYPEQEQYFDLTSAPVPSLYVVASAEGWKIFEAEAEASDKDILRFIEESEYLDFLNRPEEDIYALDDGEAV